MNFIKALLVIFQAQYVCLTMSLSLFGEIGYVPPAWASHLFSPQLITRLSRLPTPIHLFPVKFYSDKSIQLWVKRDDLSSFDLSGNKVRKLEFLLSDAVRQNCDSVITIGGIQSNHARATAVASRQLGLDPYLILRTSEPDADPGLDGNLMLSRMVGCKIYTVTPSTYAQIGSTKLTEKLEGQLKAAGKKPYVIPVGGSNGLGSWGYLEFVRELEEQIKQIGRNFDHIVFACGSG